MSGVMVGLEHAAALELAMLRGATDRETLLDLLEAIEAGALEGAREVQADEAARRGNV